MIGQMGERLVIQQNAWPTITISTLVRSGGTATVTTVVTHGYATGDYVAILGAVPTDYNGTVKVTGIISVTIFTFAVSGSPSTPATGAMTVTYVSDAQGGRQAHWRDLATVWAEQTPIRAIERLQFHAVQSDVTYRFRVRSRTDLTVEQRALWTPRWPPGAAQHTLEVNGVLPFEDGRTYLLLECSESPAR